MLHRLNIFALISVFLIPANWSAQARPFTSYISEFRAGGFVHDVESIDKNDVDLNLEILLQPLRHREGHKVLEFFLSPRPHLGTTINFAGDTSEAYLGLTWDIPLGETLFMELSFGGAVHDGKLKDYGCRASFRESASLGINLSENWRLVGTIDHMSNASLCSENGGLTNAGLRLGYRF